MKHHHVYRTELSPVSFLQRSAYVFPDKTAVIHGSRRYSYRQLEERVNRLASALRKAGLKKHDRVAFICPNTPPMLEAHYGVPLAGGILVAVNIRLSPDEVGYILKHSGSTFLFVDQEFDFKDVKAEHHEEAAILAAALEFLRREQMTPKYASPRPISPWKMAFREDL